MKKLPAEALEFFRKQGSIGGRKAAASMTPEERLARARKASESMTPEQRSARAKKASAASVAARRKKARAKNRP